MSDRCRNRSGYHCCEMNDAPYALPMRQVEKVSRPSSVRVKIVPRSACFMRGQDLLLSIDNNVDPGAGSHSRPKARAERIPDEATADPQTLAVAFGALSPLGGAVRKLAIARLYTGNSKRSRTESSLGATVQFVTHIELFRTLRYTFNGNPRTLRR